MESLLSGRKRMTSSWFRTASTFRQSEHGHEECQVVVGARSQPLFARISAGLRVLDQAWCHDLRQSRPVYDFALSPPNEPTQLTHWLRQVFGKWDQMCAKMRHNDLEAVDLPTNCVAQNPETSMADDRDAEIREIKLKIENLLVAASVSGLPQEATVAYLKELQALRQRLHDLGGDKD